MTRRKALLMAAALLVLLASILGGIQVVAAIQGGGEDTRMTKSVVRITYTGTVNGQSLNNKEICTGSVVGDRWVLTAWHCLGGGSLDWSGFTVQLWQAGAKDINHPDWYSRLDMEPKVLDGGGAVSGDTISNDVTLMHTKKTMPDWAKTIPTAPKWPGIGTALTEYGYGNLNHPLAPKGQTPPPATPAKNLQKSRDGSIVRTDCPKTQHWLLGHLCTTATQGFFPWEQRSLAWPGDSGGPLLWWNNGYWQQVGSFSTYPDPDTKKEPDQYWRSFWSEADTHTRNWILSWVFSPNDGKTPGAPPLAKPTDGNEAILRDRNSGASWLYLKNDVNKTYQGGYRYWIADGGTYNCLIHNGVHVIDIDSSADDASKLGLPLRTIEALPDMVGTHAPCISPPPPTPTLPPVATVTPITHTPPTVTPIPQHPQPTVTPAPQHHAVNAYDNYGQSNLAGHAMCRGNPDNPLSMPGGTGTQTFTVPSGVASLSSAKVQVDPASVTAHMSLAVNSSVKATATATAVGDTKFSFGPVPVHAGDVITLKITFTATYGKIITLYTVGNPGGKFTASNSCPDGAPNFSTTSSGLRAVVSGMS